jgi:60kDa lysophospholipase
MDSSVSESRVLIIYTGEFAWYHRIVENLFQHDTGGTIGMLVGSHGYVPEPYFLTETLRSQSRFHDPFQDSLFSHSASVEHYREWSTTSSANQSGTSSPLYSSATHRDLAVSVFSTPTLLVRSSRPIGTPASLKVNNMAADAQPICKKVSDNVYEAHLQSLVTPRSSIPGGAGTKRIRYAVLEV